MERVYDAVPGRKLSELEREGSVTLPGEYWRERVLRRYGGLCANDFCSRYSGGDWERYCHLLERERLVLVEKEGDIEKALVITPATRLGDVILEGATLLGASGDTIRTYREGDRVEVCGKKYRPGDPIILARAHGRGLYESVRKVVLAETDLGEGVAVVDSDCESD